MINNNIGLEAIGNSLIEHVRDAAASRPGIIEELFPYIVQASKKISVRAISRFLEEKHGVKVSYVTVGRALRDPLKYWNLYYNRVEEQAWIVAETHSKNLKDFISEPEKYQAMLEEKPVYICDGPEEIFEAQLAYDNAVADLDQKWFCLDEKILEEARQYIRPRFDKKPGIENQEDEQG
jgi:hypothetical protein